MPVFSPEPWVPRSRGTRAVAAVIVAVLWGALVATVGLPSIAVAAGAEVTGTVVRGDDGTAVAGAEVHLFSETDYYTTVTGTDGGYTLDGVADGEYRLRFVPAEGSGLAATFWRSSGTWDAADPLVVAGSVPVVADMVLPVGGTIAGTITRLSDGSPVEGVVVWIESDAGGTTATTDAAGRYRATGLAAGAYILEASPPIIDDMPPELAHEYWKGVRVRDLATPVDVALGQEVTGIDFELEATGSISGRVTRADTGEPVGGVTVHAEPEAHTAGISTVSAADGTYTIAGIAPGLHYVSFDTPLPDLLDVWWPDADEMGEGDPVRVRPATETGGIDAALRPAASVSGMVRFAGYPWDGGGTVVLEAADGGDRRLTALLGGDGAFAIPKVPVGAYVLSVRPTADQRRAAAQYYPSAPTRSAAEVIDVEVGESGRVFAFDLEQGVDISGSIAAEGALDEPAEIIAHLWTGEGWEELARTTAWESYSFADPPGDVEGSYLPAGRFVVEFRAEGRCPQFWPEAEDLSSAEPFDLTPGAEKTGVDARLRSACEPAAITPGHPAITGTAVAGDTLTVDPGEWSPSAVTLAYQWLADGAELSGATGRRLELADSLVGARISVAVTGSTEGAETVTVTSPEVGPVAPAVIPAPPTLELSAARVAPGGELLVSGAGFAAESDVVLELRSTPVRLAVATTDAGGTFALRVRIPADAAVGRHHLVAIVSGEEVARVAVQVVAPLPQSGGRPPWAAVAAGALLLVAGAGLRWASRATAAATWRPPRGG